MPTKWPKIGNKNVPNLSMIAAMDEARGIGINNQLLCHLPADLKHFKALTLGKPVIMGRKTYESIGKPLPQRPNIVISNTLEPQPGIIIVPNIPAAIEKAGKVDEVMIIGGMSIYEAALPWARRIYITIIHHTFEADVYFPEINPDHWHCVQSQFRKKDDKNLYDMSFCIYEKLIGSHQGLHD